jgi:large subunit ribosomal protein L24
VNIRKGDMVRVMIGREKGKTGKVLRIDREKGKIWVERTNMVKRHQRPSQLHRQGGIIEKEAPLHVSNVMHYDEKMARASRIGMKVVDGRKVRYLKRSGEVLAAAK